MSQQRKPITAKFAGTCRECKRRVGAGETVFWAARAGIVCAACTANDGVPDGVMALVQDALADDYQEALHQAAKDKAREPDRWPSRARTNDVARRYGPVGRFNRARVAPAPVEDPAIGDLGPDALRAEIDACCAVLSDEWDGTPDEIFYRSERDGRRYEAYHKTLDALCAEQARRAAPADDGMDDYCGEDDLTEAAIEARNDEWASMQTEIDARHGM